MSIGRIAVTPILASVIASTAALSSQQAGTHLTIQVTDISGAPIPKAQIEIMSREDGKLLASTADGKGIADLRLEPGEYQYRIAYPAFCPKNDTVTIDPIWSKEIQVKLKVDSCPGPCSPPCVTVLGVEPKVYPVTIKVIDPTRALVPGALVEIDPSSASSKPIKTDGNGQVVVGLPAGRHSLRVSVYGFRRWTGFAEVQGTEEVITAKLRISGTPIQKS